MSMWPGITIVHAIAAPGELVWAVELGCEEESVPTVVRIGEGGAQSLSCRASEQSGSFLGIGIDAGGSIVVHDDRLDPLDCLISVTCLNVKQAQTIGVAAGRILKGRPLEAGEIICPSRCRSKSE